MIRRTGHWTRNLLTCAVLAPAAIGASPEPQSDQKPEKFVVNAQATTKAGGLAATMDVAVDRYSTEAERSAAEKALRAGHAMLVESLRKAPAIGRITSGDRTFEIKWARRTPREKGSTILLVTDAPIFFVGAGLGDAPPTEGYDLGVLRFEFDTAGIGFGTMAGAARVRYDAQEGLVVDDYAEIPIKLRVMRGY